MDYIGSKEKLNDWLFSIMLDNGKVNTNGLVFMDACAGSGSVSKYAARLGFKKIISNDIMEFPSHIIRGAISLPISKYDEAIALASKMNSIESKEGFFFKNYSESSGRLYFSDENAKKIDGCRSFIEEISDDIYIKSYLLYCLLESLSSVSNTTGVQAAFLKKLKDRAKKTLVIKPHTSLCKYQLVKTFNKDILALLKSSSFRDGYEEDILYVDPPYNERQYGPNYHLYETLVKYDNPEIYGKTGLRDWKNESKSDFCSKKSCLSFIREIVDNTTAQNVFMSYNSDGLLSLEEIANEFKKEKFDVFEMDQKRYKSDSSEERVYNDSVLKEFLFKIGKQ